jgi:Major Facilitator Superfamily.
MSSPEKFNARFMQGGLLLGSCFAYYDTALFGFISPLLAPQFFPEFEPLQALIMTYALIPLGMLAKPMGAWVFGSYADRFGLQKMLYTTATGLLFVTMLMGCLPTYQTAGILAPILLLLGRFLQNFFAAGEKSGTTLCLLESSKTYDKVWMSSLAASTSTIGILMASLGAWWAFEDPSAERWRMLYFLGFLTGVSTLFLRWLPQTALKKRTETSMPYHFSINLAVVWMTGMSYFCYTTAFIWINPFIASTARFTEESLMGLTSSLIIFDLILMPIFGKLGSVLGARRLMQTAAILIALLGGPLILASTATSWFIIVTARIALVILGVGISAPLQAWTWNRSHSKTPIFTYSISTSLGSLLIGAPTSALQLWIFHLYGPEMVAFTWSLAGLITTCLLAWESQEHLPRVA